MKRLLVVLGILLALIVVLVLVGPSMIDWNRYKGEIVSAVERTTGRSVALDGDINLEILPSPRLTFSRLRLANPPGASGPELLRIKGAQALIAFAPLFKGRIQVERMLLDAPVLSLERLPSGEGNWAGLTLPDWLQLDHLDFSDGSVSYRDDRNGFAETASHIDGSLVPNTPNGPLFAEGKAVAQGVAMSFQASLERAGGDRPAGLELRLAAAGGELAFDGTLADNEATTTLAGKLHLAAPQLAAFAAGLGLADAKALPALLAQSFVLDGTLDVGAGRVALSGVDFRLGDSEAKGGIDYARGDPPRLNATLSFDQIDLDKAAAAGSPSDAKVAAPANPTPAEAAPLPISLNLPGMLAATVDISIDGVVYKGGVLRQVELKASLDKGAVKVSQLSAELPGGSDVTISGSLATPGGKPNFNGTLEAASDDLRGLLEWLKIDISHVPAERLRKVVLSAGFGLTAEELDLHGLDANIDSTHLVGGANILLRVRPAFGASLAVDRLNLDGYLAPAPGAGSAAATAASPPTAPAATPLDALNWLDSFDANIRARIDHLIFRGQEITGLRLDGTVQAGTLTLHEAAVDDLAGVKGKLSGSVSGSAEKAQVDLSLDASAADLAGFMRFAGVTAAVSPDRLGVFAVKGKVKGGLDLLALDISGSALGGSYKAVGSIGLVKGTSYDLDLSLDEPRLAVLMGLLAPPPPPPADLGSLALAGHFKGRLGALAVSGLRAQSGLLDATGAIDLSGLPDKPVGKVDLALTLRRVGYLLSLVQPGGRPASAMLDRLGPLAIQLKADGDELGITLDNEIAVQGGSFSVTGRVGNAEKGLAYDLTLKADDPDLTPLVAALLPGTDAKGLGPLKLGARLAGGLENVSLSDLAVSSSLLDASGSVELRDMVEKPTIKAALDLDAKRLPMLLALAGTQPSGVLGRLQSFGVKGKIEGPTDAMTVDMVLAGDKATASLKGSAGLSDAGASYDLAIAAADPDFPALLHLLAPDYRPGAAAAGDFRLQAMARGKPGAVTLADIQAKLGSLAFSGGIAAALGGPRPKYDLRIDAGQLDLGAWLPFKTAAEDTLDRRPRGQAALVASSHWSSAPFDLSMLRSSDADLAFSGQMLSYGRYRIEGAKLAASLRDGVLDVTELSGRLADGELKLTGRLDAQAAAKAALAFRLDHAKLDQDGLHLGPLRLANGTFSVSGELRASGASELGLARSLSGDGTAALTDTSLEGVDIPALDDRLNKLDRSSDILGLVRSLTSGGSSKLNRLAGNFTVREGVIENRDLALELDGAQGRGQGVFDLPRWYMDYGVEFKLAGAQGVPPFSIKLRGPLDDPRKFILANELQEYLLDRGMKAILKDVRKAVPPPGNNAAPAQ